MTKDRGRILVATNRKARHLYVVLETLETGISLVGNEVKSLRLGRAALGDAFASVEAHEVWMYNLHIAEYASSNLAHQRSRIDDTTRRKRKLLLHRTQIVKWETRVHESGLSLVPLSMYFADGLVKVELALVRGKKTWDRRHDLAARDAQREVERAMSDHVRGRRRARPAR
ncbi:SsrA-binding protein SmpB [uncultured Jatrophihabitans sp.]|uniref:SsrA-binding protein SmpB n=1 Tax=uncultured Jatrophihabitans sp. TaxID=1610747 RepID=UPI0035CAC929